MTRGPRRRLAAVLLLLGLAAGACRGANGEEASLSAGPASSTSTSTSPSTVATSTTASTTTTRLAATTTAAAATSTAAPATSPTRARRVNVQAWTPFATAGGVVLRHPSTRVERVGFHQSNIDGAQQLDALPTATDPITLEGRDRDTAPRGAADVVVDPDVEIRSPVSGKVLYAGTYVLYCRYSDDFVVIEPDSHPGWEVKVLHIDGVRVRPGMRVEAAETVLAPRPTRLPFASQVEEVTASPPWPHVHLEIIDPSIPDRPSGSGC